MPDTTDGGKAEYLAESLDIVEAFSRTLLLIDAGFRKGTTDPALLNEAFRAIHTLKGLAGLFGIAALSSMTHVLEDLLDGLRLGRIAISPPVLDVLFGAVDASYQILGNADEASSPAVLAAVNGVVHAVQRLSGQTEVREANPYGIDPDIVAVLTEYEEHRLHSSLKAGLKLYKVRGQFDLMTIDTDLERLKDRARGLGEVITYLPTGESTSVDILELDLLLASGEALDTLTTQLGTEGITVEQVASRASAPPVDSVILSSAPPASVAIVDGEGVSGPNEGTQLVDRAIDQKLTRRAVRVDIRKLDYLMNVVGELAILRGVLVRTAQKIRTDYDRNLGRDLFRMQRTLERRLEDLQDGILEMRMVPLGQVFDRLARGVRQISRELGKEVRLVITGSDTEIDKLIVEELGDPLLHMLRNAIDHGIETEADRVSAKKVPSGTIALNAYQKGNHVLIEVEDDGRGIDEVRLLQRAEQLGVLAVGGGSELTREDVLALIFLPGLSTSVAVSQVSGRGVGMDVVKTNISRLGGVIDVQSERGIGTKLTLTLPITLAVVRALLVRVADQIFAIPLSSVSEVLALESATRIVDGREVITLRKATLPLCRLRAFFGLEARAAAYQRAFVVVARVGERRLGLVVDSISGQQDVVIKSLGRSLQGLRGFAGATELGDQRVALVVDAAAVVEDVFSAPDARRKVTAHA